MFLKEICDLSFNKFRLFKGISTECGGIFQWSSFIVPPAVPKQE